MIVAMRPVFTTCILLLVAGCSSTSIPQYTERPGTAKQTPQPAFAGIRAEFDKLSAHDVSNLIANQCALRGYQVLKRTEAEVHCGKELKPEDSGIAAYYADDKLSSEPQYRVQFVLNVVGLDTRASAVHWIEVEPILGDKRNVGSPDENDPRYSLRLFLQQIGGAPLT